jgi:hypothetical protein
VSNDLTMPPPPDPAMVATSVMAGVLWRHRLVVTPFAFDYCASQIGETCGWTTNADEPLCHALHRDHLTGKIMDALNRLGLVVVPAERIADLERKNANLGRLAAGGAPAGYALVRAEDVL